MDFPRYPSSCCCVIMRLSARCMKLDPSNLNFFCTVLEVVPSSMINGRSSEFEQPDADCPVGSAGKTTRNAARMDFADQTTDLGAVYTPHKLNRYLAAHSFLATLKKVVRIVQLERRGSVFRNGVGRGIRYQPLMAVR